MTLQDLMSADLDVYLSDFGEDASFSRQGGAPSTIKVLFDNDFLTTLGVETSGPSALCKSSDVSAAAHGDTLEIGGVTYNITGIQPDGTGFTLLILSRE